MEASISRVGARQISLGILAAGRAGRADIRGGQHTLGVCQTGIRFCRVFDDRQRAVAAPSCNGRRVSDVLAVRGRACDSWGVGEVPEKALHYPRQPACSPRTPAL